MSSNFSCSITDNMTLFIVIVCNDIVFHAEGLGLFKVIIWVTGFDGAQTCKETKGDFGLSQRF